MTRLGIYLCLVVLSVLPALPSAEQAQSCPLNSNFSSGNLTHWQAYTGNNKDGNDSNSIKLIYDSTQSFPGGTIGAVSFTEYNLPSVNGIRVITGQGIDPFGGFQTIPTINGYSYHYAILLGSTAISRTQAPDPTNGQPNPIPQPTTLLGGYVRGIRYLINVPAGPPSLPYTMTYAYAMVLENGTHASSDQPMARAIVSTPGGVIDCASPEYFLPTNGGLDSATIRQNGFSPSPTPSPNTASGQPQGGNVHLQDVWTKPWTEVTFDLSAYRGQQVSLTFEADNCVPGGHFAYAYFALRDVCAGLQISGDSLACANSIAKYSIPSLNGASYTWSVPDGWNIEGDTSNTIAVKVGPQSGWVVAKEANSCTNLTDSLFVQLYKGALPQATIDPRDTTICYGQSAPLQAIVTTGTEFTWTKTESLPRGGDGVIPADPFAVGMVVTPLQTSDYILNIRNEGCPIPISDTFTVTIVAPIRVNPGKDTLVVVNEPLHFQATSSDPYKDRYEWSPSVNLSNPEIANPIGLYPGDIDSITYQVTATDTFGCYGSASVKVIIAHTLPDIFVPNAFTPGAGSNRIFRPVCMGISSLEYFQVYNRWGQRVYSTSQMGQGWDGRVQGKLQESNTYLWMARGMDYRGKVIARQGTVVLIR